MQVAYQLVLNGTAPAQAGRFFIIEEFLRPLEAAFLPGLTGRLVPVADGLGTALFLLRGLPHQVFDTVIGFIACLDAFVPHDQHVDVAGLACFPVLEHVVVRAGRRVLRIEDGELPTALHAAEPALVRRKEAPSVIAGTCRGLAVLGQVAHAVFLDTVFIVRIIALLVLPFLHGPRYPS